MILVCVSAGGAPPPPNGTQTKPVRVSYVDWVARQWLLIPPCHQRLHACELTGFVFLFFSPSSHFIFHQETSSSRWNPPPVIPLSGGGVGLLFFSETVSVGSLLLVDRHDLTVQKAEKVMFGSCPCSGVGGV